MCKRREIDPNNNGTNKFLSPDVVFPHLLKSLSLEKVWGYSMIDNFVSSLRKNKMSKELHITYIFY